MEEVTDYKTETSVNMSSKLWIMEARLGIVFVTLEHFGSIAKGRTTVLPPLFSTPWLIFKGEQEVIIHSLNSINRSSLRIAKPEGLTKPKTENDALTKKLTQAQTGLKTAQDTQKKSEAALKTAQSPKNKADVDLKTANDAKTKLETDLKTAKAAYNKIDGDLKKTRADLDAKTKEHEKYIKNNQPTKLAPELNKVSEERDEL